MPSQRGVKKNPLSPRETEVLGLVAQGMTSREISDELGIQKCTVDYHLERVFRKLGVRNRVHAVRISLQRGYIPLYASDEK